MKIETLLHEEIESEFEKLKDVKPGTEEYKVIVDGLTKLVDRAIEIDKLNIENEREVDNQEHERKFKLIQINDEKKDRWIKHGLTVAGIVLPLSVTIWGTIKTIEFEKEGTVTTLIGRGFFNSLLPKK